MKIFGIKSEIETLRKAVSAQLEIWTDMKVDTEFQIEKIKPKEWDELHKDLADYTKECDAIQSLLSAISQDYPPDQPVAEDLEVVTAPEPTPPTHTQEPTPPAPDTAPSHPEVEKEKSKAKAKEPRVVAGPVVETNGDNSSAFPTSSVAVNIGLNLPEPFTQTDLRARLDGDATARGYQWVAAWKNAGWIDTAGFGSYRRTDKFGK